MHLSEKAGTNLQGFFVLFFLITMRKLKKSKIKINTSEHKNYGQRVRTEVIVREGSAESRHRHPSPAEEQPRIWPWRNVTSLAEKWIQRHAARLFVSPLSCSQSRRLQAGRTQSDVG